ncbi:MAG: (d)CMP kinase [Methylobacteriaceae bacterium]|jgi:cytidylate kinase|nr:(d)CMP kinase [Methylobacteriaceae bacterium]
MIIAIDGPAAAGKGTLARKLADHYGLPYLDTGTLYRAVARTVLDAGESPQNEAAACRAAQTLDAGSLDDPRLREDETGKAASVVSAYPGVRRALLEFQRSFAHAPEGAVLDGRDIGTVIAPDADIKFFVTASPEVRALRRQLEYRGRGLDVPLEQVLEDVRRRDERDATRAEAPLKAAPDALVVDTSELNAEEVFKAAVQRIERLRGCHG